ncbi:MAG: fibronectin type III domain-containing protein [Verrucomicrobiota bacterium JB025]|nr:fibronectin type III domain-containing protein [Verrucomicrobiota bacterium JB025]
MFRVALNFVRCSLVWLAVSLPLSAEWVSSNRSGDLVYFFFASPARAEVYDMAAEEWLDPVVLPTKADAIVTGYADADGIYVSYGRSIYRYDSSGGGETFLFSSALSVNWVASDGPLLFVNGGGAYSEGYGITSVSKTTNTILDAFSSGSYNQISGLQLVPQRNELIGMYSNSIQYFTYDENGTISGRLTRASVSYPYPSEYWYYPDGSMVLSNLGTVYEGSRNQELVEYDIAPEHVDFRGSDVLVTVEDGGVHAYNNAGLETGVVGVSHEVSALHVEGDDVFVFGTQDDEIVLTKIAFADLGDPQPEEPRDPTGLAYTPESVFVGNDGIVYLFSRSHRCLFRWDPESQAYLSSLNLDGAPWYVAYSSVLNRVYLSYPGGEIERASLYGDQLSQYSYASTGETNASEIIAAKSYLISVEQGTYNTIRAFNSSGNEVDSVSSGDSSPLFWNDAEQMLYYTYSGRPRAIPFRASSSKHPSLAIGEFGSVVGSSYDSEDGYVELTSDGSMLVASSGAVYETATMGLSSVSLANEVVDGVLESGRIKTIRNIGGVAQVQAWVGSFFLPGAVKQLPGEGVNLELVSGGMVAVILDEEGVPGFYVMDGDFGIVAPEVLARPEGLFASVVDSSSVLLGWNDVSGEEEYRVERLADGESEWTEVGTTGTSLTECSDDTVALGNVYQYRVIAVNGDKESEASEPVLVEMSVPGVLADLASGNVTDDVVVLEWTPVVGATGYEGEYRSVSSSSWTTMSIGGDGGADSVEISGLYATTDYVFRVRSVNGIGSSEWSIIEVATLVPDPVAPNYFRLSGTTSYEVSLYWWSTVSSSEYVIERRVPGGDWEQIAIVSGGNYADTAVDPGSYYEYRCFARNYRGESDYSEIVEVTTSLLEVPDSPGISLMHGDGGAVEVRWVVNSPVAESVRIERSLEEGDDWVVVGSAAYDEGSILDDTTEPGFRYVYRVYAINSAGESGASSQAIVSIDGDCLIEDDFESLPHSPWVELEGGEHILDGGEGFPAGGVYWFGGSWERSLVSVPLDLSYGGTVALTVRMGDGDSSGPWDGAESDEGIQIQYRTAESGWTVVTDIPITTTGWEAFSVALPASAWTDSTQIRIIQEQFSGPGYDTWAIDSYCILGQRVENEAPVFAESMPTVVTANAAGDPITLRVGDHVSDPNVLDRTYFSVVEASNPEIFSLFTIDLESGLLSLEFAPYQDGSSTLVIEASDDSGATASTTLTVNLPALAVPSIISEGTVTLNAATGLYEQSVTVANNGSRAIAGFRIRVIGLDQGYMVYGFPEGYLDYDSVLEPGESVTLSIEYHSSTSGDAPRPAFEIDVLYPDGSSAGDSAVEDGDGPQLINYRDEAKLFEFDAVVGQRYRIQYATDLGNWIDSPTVITAGANRVQWLDQGPPKTECHPAQCPVRFYRAVLVED